MFKRAIIIALPSVKIGTLPVLVSYRDLGVHVFIKICSLCRGLYLPTLEKMGLGLS